MKEDTTIAKALKATNKLAACSKNRNATNSANSAKGTNSTYQANTTERQKFDEAFKKFLSEKIILAWIMKSCVVECRDLDVTYIAEHCIEGTPEVGKIPVLPDETNTPLIEGVNTEDTSMTEGTVRYDIRFRAVIPGSDAPIQLILNCEGQSDFHPGYPLITRAVYYCSRMISSQYGKEFDHFHYEMIKKVYSIFICTKPPKRMEHTINAYHITEGNLVGHAVLNVKHYDLLTAVMVCLGNPDTADEGSVLRLLDVIVSGKMNAGEKMQLLENDFQIPMTRAIEGKVSEMCNVSQGIYESGVEDGLSQGLSQGLVKGEKRGFKRGEKKATKMIALNMAELNIPLEKIAAATQEKVNVINRWIKEHKATASGQIPG
jgi:hypothetical protein